MIITWNANIITEDQTAGGGHNAGDQHERRHLPRVVLHLTLRNESSPGHLSTYRSIPGHALFNYINLILL